jgi:hypothetical protein
MNVAKLAAIACALAVMCTAAAALDKNDITRLVAFAGAFETYCHKLSPEKHAAIEKAANLVDFEDLAKAGIKMAMLAEAIGTPKFCAKGIANGW